MPERRPATASHPTDPEGVAPAATPAAAIDSPTDAVIETDLPYEGRRTGKVRDVYRIPAGAGEHERVLPERVLLVATDRISAFDVVLPTPIPGKGRLLTAMSVRWFAHLRTLGIVDDHLLSDDASTLPGLDDAQRRRLAGRVMVCRPARVVPIECVARGYLAGSGWQEYRRDGRVCGVPLPSGLREGDRLPEPIFTPATKADEGHDENIPFERAAELVGSALMERLRTLTLSIYRSAHDLAKSRGLVIADTKFEFGHATDGTSERDRLGTLMLVDEALTSDSSRYWPAEAWRPGAEQPSFDKQFVRNWLLEEERHGRWNRQPPGPALPVEVVEATRDRYREAIERLWGMRSA